MSNIMDALDALAPTTGSHFTSTLNRQLPDALKPTSNRLPSPFVVCLTGASRGIGQATAQIFAAAGATGLIITARSISSLESTIQKCTSIGHPDLKITPLALEAGSEADTAALAEAIKTQHGRLDLLINNAGLVSSHESAFQPMITDIRPDQFRVTMETNYFGRALMMQALIPLLLSSPTGAKMIINVTSICSHLVGVGAIGFNCSEIASNRLTEIVAARYKEEGLLAFSVHPGEVPTTGPVGAPKGFVEACRDSPEICGGMCLWLLRERPEWLSGRYVSSEWDTMELEKRKEEIVEGNKLVSRLAL